MPQELKPPYQGGGYYSTILLDRPEFGAHIATIVHMWTMIEHELADLMVFMQGGDRSTTMTIYLSLVSFELRLSVLRSVAKLKLPTALYERFINDFCKKARKRANERNRIAHALWAENGAFPDGIIMLPHSDEVFYRDKSVQLYRIKDFEQIEQRLMALHTPLSSFVHEVSQLRVAEEQKRSSSRSP